MSRKDYRAELVLENGKWRNYRMVAEALRVTGETDMEVYSAEEPGATWWRVVNELIVRFKADNPRFNEAIFRAAAYPEPGETA